MYSKSKSRPNLTEYQRNVIRFCSTNGQTADQIRALPELAKADGSKPQKQTIDYWITRLNQTGDVQLKKNGGRPRKLNPTREARLVQWIERHPKVDYSTVATKFARWKCKPRTINEYALRNKISK